MKGTVKQIAWANDIIETVVGILTDSLDVIKTESIPDSMRAEAEQDINRKIEAIKSADYAGDIISLFKSVRRSGNVNIDAESLVSVYRVAVPMTDGERKILGK